MTPNSDSSQPGSDSDSVNRVVAIVLNWNGGDETAQCLASLRALEGVQPRILLADNASTDGSVERMQAEFVDLHVLRFEENLGYAGGNNRAMRHAYGEMGAEWVCLLNSDVVAEPEMFNRLLGAVQTLRAQGHDQIGALGPCIYYRDQPHLVWANGGCVRPTANVTQLIDHGRRAAGGRVRGPEARDYIPGTCLLVSRQAWEVVGGLDESFFCYLEDADWGLRMASQGFGVFVVPGASAYHALSSSTGGGYSAGRKYMTAVNSVHFLRKHGNWRGWAAFYFYDVLLWPLAFARGLVLGRGHAALAKIQGVYHGLRGRRVNASVAARYARRSS
jgi:GT2 family glycosyltransferase